MHLNRLVLLAACFALTVKADGQRRRPDPDYILEFPGTVTVRTFLGEKISDFALIDGQRDEQLEYRPNNILGLGLGVSIRGVSLNLSTRLPYHDSKEGRFGKTRHLDLQLHRYRGNFALDVYFQHYRGFHLEDSSDVTAVVSATDYPYFPDMQEMTIGVSGLYVFNGRRYSLRAPVNQQDWQIHSAGSWLLGGTVFTHFVDNGGQSIIPPYLKHPEFMNGNQVERLNNYGVTANGGYGYNFVIRRHWFIGLQADLGAGVSYSEIKDQSGITQKAGLQLSANSRLAFGYNAARWFGGFYAIYHADRYPLSYDESFMRANGGVVRLVAARRLITHKRFLGGLPD
jgi:hypothetical protein